MKRCRARCLVMFFVFDLLTVGQWAIAQTQAGSVNGTVSDPNGDPLPGVTVTLSGSSLMGTRSEVTGPSGGFRFPTLLPGGGYVVELALDGFQGRKYESIVVQLGQTTTLLATLELATVQREIVVTGASPIVDVTSPVASTNFSEDLLTNTPNLQRDPAQTVFEAPGVVDGSQSGYDEMYSVRGGSVIANQGAIDGVPNTLPVYNVNIGSGAVFETVQEVQVISGALPAEIGNVGGGFINMVTKSGGNQLHGEAAVYYHDDSLQSDNVSGDLKALGLEAPEITDSGDWAVSLGGPFVHDRLWFQAGVADKKLGTAVSGFPYPDLKKERYYFGKLTWQPTPSHTFVGVYNRSEWDLPWNGGDEFTTPEAVLDTSFDTTMSKIKWTGVLSQSLFLEADLARRDTTQANAPEQGALYPYFDLATNISSGAASLYMESPYRRDLGKAALSIFKDGWAGSHEFKLGVEYERSSWDWYSYQTSPIYSHYLYGGIPYLALVSAWTPGVTSRYYMEGHHAFAQDTWGVSKRVTLSLGVRMNTWDAGYPPQSGSGFTYGSFVSFAPVEIGRTTKAIDWSVFEPRLGATVTLDDQGKSVLRAGLARYHHGMDIIYLFPANPNRIYIAVSPWVDLNGNLFADPDEVFAPISYAGGASSIMDPNLRNPYTDEITLGFERELFTDFALTVNATWRRDSNLIDTVNISTDESSYEPRQVTDPGPDGVVGTPDDRPLTVYNQVSDFENNIETTNPALAERKYRGVEVIATKRLSHSWQALASVAWQRSNGTASTNLSAARGYSNAFDDPNSLINLKGPLSLDTNWQVKLVGTYVAPLGFSFSGYYLFQTGIPLYRTLRVVGLNQGPINVVADPRDTYREDDVSRLDLRAEKTFSLGARPIEIGLILDVFNAFNEAAVTSRNGDTLAGGGFERPLAVQPPRTMRVGARVRF